MQVSRRPKGTVCTPYGPFIPPPDGEPNRNDCRARRSVRLDRILLFLGTNARVDDCGLLLFLTVSVFMLTSLEWLPAAGPRSRIVLAHVFAGVA